MITLCTTSLSVGAPLRLRQMICTLIFSFISFDGSTEPVIQARVKEMHCNFARWSCLPRQDSRLVLAGPARDCRAEGSLRLVQYPQRPAWSSALSRSCSLGSLPMRRDGHERLQVYPPTRAWWPSCGRSQCPATLAPSLLERRLRPASASG
jgi:hypothetical protein